MQPFLEFCQLSYTFTPGQRSIQVSGALEAGTALALKGPSGAGKSTVLRILARLLKPVGGEVFFRGQPWYTIPPQVWRRRIHYLSQKPVMFSGSVLYNLEMPFSLAVASGTRLELDRASKMLEATGLSLSILHQDARTLSGGEMARVALVRALLVEPELLLLDEPTAFLDQGSERLVQSLLVDWLREKEERGLIIVSHKDEDLEVFTGIQSVSIEPVNAGGENL